MAYKIPGPVYPTAPNAWQGGIELEPVPEDLPFTQFSGDREHQLFWTVNLGGKSIVYRLIPQCIGTQENPQVEYYVAYNTYAGRSEFVVSPDKLDNFADYGEVLAIAAANWFTFNAHTPYMVSSTRVGSRAQRGDFKGALKALGRSWLEALQDPGWWAATLPGMAAMAGPKVEFPPPKPVPTAGSLSPAEMGSFLKATYEGNPLLQELGEVNNLGNVPSQVLHGRLIRILQQFETETGIPVQVVPEGTVQAVRGPGNFASLRSSPGVLQIEEQVFKSTQLLMDEVTHELAYHYTGGPEGVPSLGEGPIKAHTLMEGMIQRNGEMPLGLPAPETPPLPSSGSGAGAALTALGASTLAAMGKNDPQGQRDSPGMPTHLTGYAPDDKLSVQAKRVYQAMGPGTKPVSVSFLMAKTGLGPIEVRAALLELSDAGKVVLVYGEGRGREMLPSTAWKTKP
jgi:hypothetical protein